MRTRESLKWMKDVKGAAGESQFKMETEMISLVDYRDDNQFSHVLLQVMLHYCCCKRE